MYRKHIPEEDLALLNAYVREVLDNPAFFEYRQHELKQAPTLAIMRQAQQIWTLACELNRELENLDASQAKRKAGQLETLLGRVKEREYPHLHMVLQKAWDIVDLARELIEQEPGKQRKPI